MRRTDSAVGILFGERSRSIAGVQCIVSKEFSKSAMKGVRPGFRYDVDDATSDIAELSLVIVRLDLELLDVIDDRGDRKGTEDDFRVVNSIEHEIVTAVLLSVDSRNQHGS